MSTQDLQQNTKTSFVTLTLITQACHGILNTTFVAPKPKPSWFDDLNAKLDEAKSHAANWINTLAPSITGGVPLQVINYGTTFDALSSQIMSIANAHPSASGADNEYVKEVHSLLEALENSVDGIIKNAETTSAQLEAWGKLMQTSHDDLTKGAVNIQSAEADLTSDIGKMNAAIDALNATIAKENLAIAASAGGIGLGLLLLVAGIALAPETGGASLVVAGTGGLLVVGGAVTWGVMQDKINKQFDEIAKDQKKIDADKRQLVALKGLASASGQSINYINTSTTALSAFRTSWNVFQGELVAVKNKLAKGEESLQVIVSGAFTAAAQKEWKVATAFAQEIADAKITVAKKELPMDSKAA
jgi:alkylhydroperoxidase/carboxymuconolactone decarboxylase family protein YurZ